MTLFAVATCLAAMDDDLSQWLRPAAFAQLLIVVAVLLPLPRSIRNWRDGTDGLRLIRLLIEPPDDKVARAHRQWLRSMLPDAPEPAVCPFAREIQFQAHRADRYTDAWALRDSTDALRRLLTGAALVPAERAIILELAIGNELLIGDSGAGLAELDAWSLELLQIAQRPGCQVTRGSVLAVLGRPAEAQAVLAPAMRHPLDALNGIVGRVALAHVHRALGEAERAAAFWPPQADVVAVMTPSLWRTVARIEHLLARHGTGTAATDHRASLP
jgi:hypothetical protein